VDRKLLTSIVEGLIFAYSEPLNIEAISAVLQSVSPQLIQEILDELVSEYTARSRGFVLARVGGGYQFRSLPSIAPWILEIKSIKPSRLSRAALETLSIIAYNQPITRGRIEKIRGVETAGTIKNLLEKDLIVVAGRLDIPGRPLVYGTTQRFLEVFGLTDISSLPPLPEIEVLTQE
jgi:segregation and condensation protein B